MYVANQTPTLVIVKKPAGLRNNKTIPIIGMPSGEITSKEWEGYVSCARHVAVVALLFANALSNDGLSLSNKTNQNKEQFCRCASEA
jgi:hypothetical protein